MDLEVGFDHGLTGCGAVPRCHYRVRMPIRIRFKGCHRSLHEGNLVQFANRDAIPILDSAFLSHGLFYIAKGAPEFRL